MTRSVPWLRIRIREGGRPDQQRDQTQHPRRTAWRARFYFPQFKAHFRIPWIPDAADVNTGDVDVVGVRRNSTGNADREGRGSRK